MVLSQVGPFSAEPFVCVSTSRETWFDSAGDAVSLTFLATTTPHVRSAGTSRFRICRVRTNVLVRDLDLGVMNHLDGRRPEIIADGLPLFGGVQLAVNTTLVSWHCGKHVFVKSAHTLNSRERVGARLVVLAGEVGCKWSETQDFLCALAEALARSAPPLLKSKIHSAWLRRWCRILACTSAKAFAQCLSSCGRGHAHNTTSMQREGPAGLVMWICVHR